MTHHLHQFARRLCRIAWYWLRCSRLRTPRWTDEFTIVWRWRPVPIAVNDKFISQGPTRKRGFVIRRRGVFCGEFYHDLSWYRSFAKLCRRFNREDIRAPRFERMASTLATSIMLSL